MVNATANPLKLRRSARTLEKLVASERVDIVHAQSVGGAWIASMAAAQVAVWLVTTLARCPGHIGTARILDGRARARRPGDHAVELRRGVDGRALRSYARSASPSFRAQIDTAAFDPATVDQQRVDALRKTWQIPDDARILLVPGRVAPGMVS